MTSQPLRGPQIFEPDDPTLVVSREPMQTVLPFDAFDAEVQTAAPAATASVPPPVPIASMGWGTVLLSSLISLLLLAIGVWCANFVSTALARQDAIGWTATALVALAALATTILIGREIVGFLRLAHIGRLRNDADRALVRRDRDLEVATVRRVRSLTATMRRRRWDVARFREHERHMREPGQLFRLADRVLLAGADKEARRIVYESARRVAAISALIPFAGVVVLLVLRENVRMTRRLAGVYGARPGPAGGLRLLWRTLTYIAATGLLALTDDLTGQFLGQDILRRMSRRLGEASFNAALTARLGAAAVAVCRPLPFLEAPPIRARDVLPELFASLRGKSQQENTT
jgi:putative membrane protein